MSPASPVDQRMKVSTLATRPGRRREAISFSRQLIETADSPTVADRLYLAKLYLIENMTEKYEQEMLKIVRPG